MNNYLIHVNGKGNTEKRKRKKKDMIKIDLGQVCLESASGGRLANSPEGVDSG